MKKALSLILVLVMCLSLCACGGNSQEDGAEKKAIQTVHNNIQVKLVVRYGSVGAPSYTTYVTEIDTNKFEISGKVTIKDKYGDTYTGKYSAVATYDPSTGKCTVSDDYLGDLYKD